MTITYETKNNTMKIIGDISKSTFFKIGYYFGSKNLEWDDLYANAITIKNYNISDLFEFVAYIECYEFNVKVVI